MTKEKFLLISLSEKKSKQLSQTIANETCRKILDYLADKESTEAEISKRLSIPISTVHYNIQQLQKAKLIVAEEYHYSEKGKEVNHYKLANQYIIIAPKSTYGIKEKLKSIFPVVLIIAASSAFLQFSRNFFTRVGTFKETSILAVEELAADTALKAAPAAVKSVTTQSFSSYSHVALSFFIGATVALVLYLIIDWFRHRNK